jgi:Polyketide cyclase / dehydrase and lipid transport.
MTTANIKAEFRCDIETVWDIVTSLDNYTWRSDLKRIEVLIAGKKFEEHLRDGCVTTFIITRFEPMKRYEFDMDNKNMQGHWVGLFSYEEGITTIDFTEDVTVKKALMKPFVGIYLKKQQAKYVSDLKKVLE